MYKLVWFKDKLKDHTLADIVGSLMSMFSNDNREQKHK